MQEIQALERFASDAQAACFRASAGDLQIGLLSAGVSPCDLQFPSIPWETQETGCQVRPATQSVGTQDGMGIKFIDHNLKDCDLHHLSTTIMDGYLKKHHYGSGSSHPFSEGPHVIEAVVEHFQSVSPIALSNAPDSEIQDVDHEVSFTRPFRGVHLLSYIDDTYPVVLPACSQCTITPEQLVMAELAKLLPQKDCLLTRSAYVQAQSTDVGTLAASIDDAIQPAVTISVTEGSRSPQVAQRGPEQDSNVEVEVAFAK